MIYYEENVQREKHGIGEKGMDDGVVRCAIDEAMREAGRSEEFQKLFNESKVITRQVGHDMEVFVMQRASKKAFEKICGAQAPNKVKELFLEDAKRIERSRKPGVDRELTKLERKRVVNL